MNEPIPRVVTRWQCPCCSKSFSAKNRAKGHMARCWYNPDARSCKTCTHYDFDDSEPEVGYVGQGDVCDLGLPWPLDSKEWPTLAVNCPRWQEAAP